MLITPSAELMPVEQVMVNRSAGANGSETVFGQDSELGEGGMRTGPVQQRLHLRLVQGIAQGTLLSRAERPRDGFWGGLPALIAPSFDDITKPGSAAQGRGSGRDSCLGTKLRIPAPKCVLQFVV